MLSVQVARWSWDAQLRVSHVFLSGGVFFGKGGSYESGILEALDDFLGESVYHLLVRVAR